MKLNEFKSILCLNGELPSRDFFSKDIKIIAADGAANRLLEMGIIPALIIGDLDSVRPEYLSQIENLYHYDQNYCDFQKALMYLEKDNLLPAVIVGINGGSLDHILNNINHSMNTDCVLYAPPITGFILREKAVKHWRLPIFTKISLLGIPGATVTTKGLKWELNNAVMNFPGNNSCFNRTLDNDISITVHCGALLVLIYDEEASKDP